MKKLILSAIVMVSSAVIADAQEVFTPEAGDFSTEIQFAPFKSNGEMFSMPALSARYFITDKDAISLELGLNGRNVKDVPDTKEDENEFTKAYQGTFSIDLGYQRHFYTYKRLSLYAGAKVGYFHKFAGQTDQADKNHVTWSNYSTIDGQKYYTSNGFEIYATTGLDFYAYKGLYLGVELNLGFRDAFATNTCTKTTINGKEEETKSNIGGHDFNGGFSVQPRLRLGWTF